MQRSHENSLGVKAETVYSQETRADFGLGLCVLTGPQKRVWQHR